MYPLNEGIEVCPRNRLKTAIMSKMPGGRSAGRSSFSRSLCLLSSFVIPFLLNASCWRASFRTLNLNQSQEATDKKSEVFIYVYIERYHDIKFDL